MFSEWGQGGASRQLAQGPCRKNKPCRKPEDKREGERRRKNVRCYFKKCISYCRFVSAETERASITHTVS